MTETMTVRERVHHIIDTLPERELGTAAHVLEGLAALADPLTRALANAPDDDEPVTDAERAKIAEGWAAHHAGEGRTTEEVRREIGLP